MSAFIAGSNPCQSMGSADYRCHQYGTDRQSPIWVDPVRSSNGGREQLAGRWNPTCLQHIHRKLETWPTPIAGLIVDGLGQCRGPRLVVAVGGFWWGSPGSSTPWRVPWGCSISAPPYFRRRGRCDSCNLCRQRGQVVPRPPRPCCGNHRSGVRRRRGYHCVIPIQLTIAALGYAATFFWFGVFQGGIIFLVA